MCRLSVKKSCWLCSAQSYSNSIYTTAGLFQVFSTLSAPSSLLMNFSKLDRDEEKQLHSSFYLLIIVKLQGAKAYLGHFKWCPESLC